MLATMVLAACSSDDTTEPVVKRGMVLKANVEDTDTRATITDNGEGKWKFAFAEKDVVKVGNDKVDGYYTFTNDGTVFTSTDAKQTTEAANWCAFFPGETIDLRNQSGEFADVANKYALAGATASATTGSDGLTVTMKAKAAVLCIVGVKDGDCRDINVKTAEGYVSGLTAKKNSADFDVQTIDAKVSLLSKKGAGVYYVVVPAGVKISVYNGSTHMKTTKANGLTAGKYYTLLTGETTGKEFATINGEKVEKEWVQLWPGGPKFAKENVKDKLTFTEACKTGDDYVWGANWRTPKGEELAPLYKEYAVNTENVSAVYKQLNGSYGIEFTGVQHGYTNNKIFLHGEGKMDATGGQWTYLTSTDNKNSKTWNFYFWVAEHENGLRIFIYEDENYTTSKYMVRPVLAK